MRTALICTLVALSSAHTLRAQVVSDVMAGIRDGGGWVGIPIENGRGTYSTLTLPTAGLTLTGCVNVWYGHSGTWRIEARERVRDTVVVLAAEPGVGVPFSHKFGLQAQIDFDFRWSEPRDTTLLLWVGFGSRGQDGNDACDPRYGS